MKNLFNIIILIFISQALYANEALTRDERVVALTLLGEARGEGERGIFAVACVIQTRAGNRGLSAAQVCHEAKQFSPWNGVDRQGNYRLKKERELYHLWDSKHMMYARRVARSVCSKNIWLADITNQADHFYSKKVRRSPPYWAKKEDLAVIIGNHVFYQLRKTKKNPLTVAPKASMLPPCTSQLLRKTCK